MYRTRHGQGEPDGLWRDFFELAKGPYSGQVMVLDGIPEVIGSTAVMLGYSYNTDDEAELEEVKNELVELKPHIQAITSTNYKQSLIAGRRRWRWGGTATAPRSRPRSPRST